MNEIITWTAVVCSFPVLLFGMLCCSVFWNAVFFGYEPVDAPARVELDESYSAPEESTIWWDGPDDDDIKIVGRLKLKETLKDPGSLEIIHEEVRPRPSRRDNGEVGYYAKYRAKNGFGGYSVETFYYGWDN